MFQIKKKKMGMNLESLIFTSKKHSRVVEMPQSFGSSEVELAVGRPGDGLPAGIRGCVSLV